MIDLTGTLITGEPKQSCVSWIYKTNSWGKLPAVKCTKEAVIIDANGRRLCQHHFNRWKAKVEKHHLTQKT